MESKLQLLFNLLFFFISFSKYWENINVCHCFPNFFQHFLYFLKNLSNQNIYKNSLMIQYLCKYSPTWTNDCLFMMMKLSNNRCTEQEEFMIILATWSTYRSVLQSKRDQGAGTTRFCPILWSWTRDVKTCLTQYYTFVSNNQVIH